MALQPSKVQSVVACTSGTHRQHLIFSYNKQQAVRWIWVCSLNEILRSPASNRTLCVTFFLLVVAEAKSAGEGMAYNLYQVQMSRAWVQVRGCLPHMMSTASLSNIIVTMLTKKMQKTERRHCPDRARHVPQRIEKETATQERFWAQQAAYSMDDDASTVLSMRSRATQATSKAPTGYTSKTTVSIRSSLRSIARSTMMYWWEVSSWP